MEIELAAIQQTVATRLAMCNECPSLVKAVQVCKECGCFMPAKVWITGQSCHIGKWTATEE